MVAETTYTFTDNRGIHKNVVVLTAAQVAKHLSADPQFMFYWRRGWEPRQAAIRSLYLNPVSKETVVAPHITAEQWHPIHLSLTKLQDQL